jgi:hypothetical protein
LPVAQKPAAPIFRALAENPQGRPKNISSERTAGVCGNKIRLYGGTRADADNDPAMNGWANFGLFAGTNADALRKSQRDFINQPGVARNELRQVTVEMESKPQRGFSK